jgi:hypothetical protein
MLAEVIHGIAALTNYSSSYRPRPSLAGPERCIRKIT